MSKKISKIEVYLVSTKMPDNIADATRKVDSVGYLIVRMCTDDGLEGIGVTYHEVGGYAIKDLILRDIAPLLIGRDIFETEVVWQDLVQFLRGVGRKGVVFCAISAIDIAMWDLKGKAVGLPLYKLFGGNQKKIPAYCTGGWTSYSDDELVSEVKDIVAHGYSMVKFKVGVENGNNIERDLLRVAKVREAIGNKVKIMLDANNIWDAATSIRFANQVKKYNIMFLEEPVGADDIPGLALFKRSTDVTLATGEQEYTKYGARDLVLAEAADVIQIDCTRTGGYTEALKVAAITQAWNKKIAPHGMEHIHMHLISAMQNGLFVERTLTFEDITKKAFIDAPEPHNGIIEIPDLPGLGLVLNLEYIKKHDEK